MTLEELKAQAADVAEALKTAPIVDGNLRKRFIEVRAHLYARGIYDPVLVRFDSATVAPPPVSEIGEQLALVAAAL